MADIMITRVKNGWMIYPSVDEHHVRNPQDTRVARDTDELVNIVRDWAVGYHTDDEEAKSDA